jgi:hypothetical protein
MHYGGSWSSEHGDGIVRSGFFKEFYGDEIYEGFRKQKIFLILITIEPREGIDPPPTIVICAMYCLPGQTFSTIYRYQEQRDLRQYMVFRTWSLS